MKTIVQLTPCLMLDNNRQANFKAMQYALDNYKNISAYVVYDQEHKESDFIRGFTYIGHQPKRQGFVKPRNELLKWFYNSNFDYALWIDANETVSPSTLNDLNTLTTALANETVDVNCVFSTLGIQISQERMFAKQRKDYFDSVYLVRNKKGYEWLHGCIIKNFKKYYDTEIYIDERCDPWKGSSEDVYFSRLMRRLFCCQLCPTITVNKPSANTSTWMNKAGSYAYPPVDRPTVDTYIEENYHLYSHLERGVIPNVVRLDRIKDDTLKLLKPYKSRSKKK